ncbi:MAG TPA: GNAT family N-acetyltransferase [Candidatus Saccharimonadales bacterium]|nr:GNAT family N-acetyltransferase [Candidatus Saccharimonadales bacterium]
MPKSSFQIVQAKADDLPEVKLLLDRANQYAAERAGTPMWTAMDYVYGRLERQIKRGQCYIARHKDGSITASICCNERAVIWGDASRDGKALYIYKWMKDPVRGKTAEAIALMRFACEEAKRRGKQVLRCDTAAEHDKLIKYYQRLGFKEVRRFEYKTTGRPGVLLESPAQSVLKAVKTKD